MATTPWNELPFMDFQKAIMTQVLGGRQSDPEMNPLALSEPGFFQNPSSKKEDLTMFKFPTMFIHSEWVQRKIFKFKATMISWMNKLEVLNERNFPQLET